MVDELDVVLPVGRLPEAGELCVAYGTVGGRDVVVAGSLTIPCGHILRAKWLSRHIAQRGFASEGELVAALLKW